MERVGSINVEGTLGESLVVTVVEDVVPFHTADFADFSARRWSSPIPPREAKRPEHWHGQPDNHYAEFVTINTLLKDGWQDCLYECYYAFKEPPKGGKCYGPGTVEFRSIVGDDIYRGLRAAGDVYADRTVTPHRRPKEPDVLAYRTAVSGLEFKAVEAKRNSDSLNEWQALGLALFHLVLGADVRVINYVDGPKADG
jgi:hypothetical protein